MWYDEYMKKLTLLTFAITFLFVGVVYWSVAHRSINREVVGVGHDTSPKNLKVTNEEKIVGPHLPLPVLPAGWYAHRTSDSSYFITKQEVLSDTGAVEGDAHGDSVSVSLSSTALSPQEWVSSADQQWLSDVLVRSKIWGDVHGHQMLQVRRETEASPALTNFIFVNNRVYTITLYMYPGSQALSVYNLLIDDYSSDSTQKIATEIETIRSLMTQIYKSDKFIPDEAEQLPSVWNEIIKNRLLWKPTEQELVANPDWVGTLGGPSEDKAPAGYFIASPMLLHVYNDHGATYALMFAQTATRGYGHTSGSDIGVGIFEKENDVWKPTFISKNMNDGIGASGSAGTMSPLKIGENKYAYKNELTNMGQGAISNHKELYYFDGKTFNVILSLLASGSDGMDCASKGKENEWGETVDIRIEQVPNSDFYNLILEWGGTKPEDSNGECHVVPIEKRIEKYQWAGAKYELVK